MRAGAIIAVAALAGCAPVTPEALSRVSPSVTIESAKAPHDFAMCAASALPDAGQLMNDGQHYWIVRQYGGASFERWDFLPALRGSIAERRTGQMASFGTDRVRRCA
jgi:hypothetical protein